MKSFLSLLFLILCACTRAEFKQTELESAHTAARRIVVIGPNTTANLFALHQGDRVVGVSDYCTTAEASELPRVGGLADPSIERIVALNPDLVLVQGNVPRVEQLCQELDIPFHAFKTDSFADWFAEVSWLGEHLHVETEADALRDAMQADLQTFHQGTPSAAAPATLLVIFRRPDEASGIMVAGDTGFLNELLQLAGGRNALAGNHRDYFDLNEEKLIRAAPDWVLEFRPEASASDRGSLDASAQKIWRRDFPGLPATQSGNIHSLVGQDLLQPGPNMLDTARQMQRILSAR